MFFARKSYTQYEKNREITWFTNGFRFNNDDFLLFQQLLNEHPFHIDSMLQLSEICKMGEDSTRAAELVERTLYALEAAFHPLFNLAVGTSRLDYKRQEIIFFFY